MILPSCHWFFLSCGRIMAEPCFVYKRMACCLGHVLVWSRLIPRPLVILVLSLLPSLCHLFPSLVSPYLILLCLLSCVGSLSNIVCCILWVRSLNLVILIVLCVAVWFIFFVIKSASCPSLLYCLSLGILPFSSVLPPCGFCFLFCLE